MDKFKEGDKVKVIEGGYTGTEGIIEQKATPSCRVHEGQEVYHVISTKVVGFSYRAGTSFIFSVDQLEHRERRVEGQMVHPDDVIKGDLIRVETDDEDMNRQYKGEVFAINNRYNRLVLSTEKGRVLFNSIWENECKITLIKKGIPSALETAEVDDYIEWEPDKANGRVHRLTKFKGDEFWMLTSYTNGNLFSGKLLSNKEVRKTFERIPERFRKVHKP